jgi:hypothetical protein
VSVNFGEKKQWIDREWRSDYWKAYDCLKELSFLSPKSPWLHFSPAKSNIIPRLIHHWITFSAFSQISNKSVIQFYRHLTVIEIVNNNLSNGLLPIRSSVSLVEEKLTKFCYVVSIFRCSGRYITWSWSTYRKIGCCSITYCLIVYGKFMFHKLLMNFVNPKVCNTRNFFKS